MILTLIFTVDLTALAQALDSKQAHTSFGKLPLSVEKTANCYSFPVARKDDAQKVYISGLTQQENIGKNSSCFYQYDDKIKYGDVSVPPIASIIWLTCHIGD